MLNMFWFKLAHLFLKYIKICGGGIDSLAIKEEIQEMNLEKFEPMCKKLVRINPDPVKVNFPQIPYQIERWLYRYNLWIDWIL